MKKLVIVFSIILISLFTSCAVNNGNNEGTGQGSPVEKQQEASGTLSVSFIDVGQGDSTLIRTPDNEYVIIDGGSKKENNKLFNYLNKQNIHRIYAVIATHPHEDHIGNLDDIIQKYDVDNVYAPKASASTKSFRDFMTAVQSKGLKIKKASAGVKFSVGGVEFEFIAPNSEKYEDLNNYSSAVKVSYGKNSFLIMGDAEKMSEEEILSKGFDIKSDVIKVGHHGSSSSSSKKFISTVKPQYAVISCGKNNDYGHPHRETLKLLNDLNIKVYRTDINGTVVFISDGKTIKINSIK